MRFAFVVNEDQRASTPKIRRYTKKNHPQKAKPGWLARLFSFHHPVGTDLVLRLPSDLLELHCAPNTRARTFTSLMPDSPALTATQESSSLTFPLCQQHQTPPGAKRHNLFP